MIVKIKMKNVILRGKIYYFRMRVPASCQSALEKREIVESLKTENHFEAEAAAKKRTAYWAAEFKKIRAPKAIVPAAKRVPAKVSDPFEEVKAFRRKLLERANESFPEIFEKETAEDLRKRAEDYLECISIISFGKRCSLHLPEIGIDDWPLEPVKNQRVARVWDRMLVDVLQQMRHSVYEELGESLPSKKQAPESEAVSEAKVKKQAAKPSSADADIDTVVEQMLRSKEITDKARNAVRADVRLLKEWLHGKSDLTAYTKNDMISFLQDCLPYVPKNMLKHKIYAEKSLRECVALVQSDLKLYPPIAHRTCENRMMNLLSVFNYARNHLGIISVNLAKGIAIPKVRVIEKKRKSYTDGELMSMWSELDSVRNDVEAHPSRYWSVVLCLYHGFRLNEVCSLFLKDIYEDDAGVYVIDINKDGENKSVKNNASIRIVPVHPYVRDGLGFRKYVTEQQEGRSEGLLFYDTRYVEGHGYRQRVSKWFSEWKQNWLPNGALHKNCHGLRHTFMQTAQNVAGMSDRCAQEITGHSVEGVSAVHLGYSGRLRPEALLNELKNVLYGWE